MIVHIKIRPTKPLYNLVKFIDNAYAVLFKQRQQRTLKKKQLFLVHKIKNRITRDRIKVQIQ